MSFSLADSLLLLSTSLHKCIFFGDTYLPHRTAVWHPKSLYTVRLYSMSEGAVWGIPTVGRGHTHFYALIFPVTSSFHFLVYSYFWISLIISFLGDTRNNFSDRGRGFQPRHDATPFIPQQQGDNWVFMSEFFYFCSYFICQLGLNCTLSEQP